MAPEPYRGRRNDSTLLPQVAQKLAEIKGSPRRRLWMQPGKTPAGCLASNSLVCCRPARGLAAQNGPSRMRGPILINR
ncbi:MAG: hypothetical protein ACLSAP_05625 [Oscillospiraceae bacterium]